MTDKVILITGATGGIGKAAATALAKQGHTIIIHGRNEQKVEHVRDEIKATSGNEKIDTLVADMFLLSDVRKMAEVFKHKYDRLDVLVNNAGGIMGKRRETTSEGIEKTIAVNLLAPFLLTGLLMNSLKKSQNGRIINVSSSSHKLNAKPNFNDFQLGENYDPLRAYGNAKLFLIWVTQHLAVEMKQAGMKNITANSMHPGAVATNFGVESNLGSLLNFVGKLARPFFRSAEQGADTLIYMATANEISSASGKYFINRKPAKVSTKYYTAENEKMIWDYCNRLAGGPEIFFEKINEKEFPVY
jgi:NAD(P)-dependent dehydrogenase (short-subunit alcohol dehydrogenase family)